MKHAMHKPWSQHRRYCLPVCLLLGVWTGSALSAGNAFSNLADPTKPPEGFGKADAGATALDGTNAFEQQTNDVAIEPADSTVTEQAIQPALTLIRIDVRTGQGMAILHGRMVRVGDRINDGRVIAINATGVELDTPQGKQKYSLWQKTSVADLMTDAASKNGGKDKP